ncbi:hypothetical protein [Nonomuraea helvata]|uniref:DUF2637 domain-containing protein n=1 Tax=Nonomuraea helvata TaxID=37484 RepID=A0ABV5RY37_9ACTN
MGIRSTTMYAAGLASIGLSVASWATSLRYERAGIDRADRWGIFIGQWAPTFFALGTALQMEETRQETMSEEQRMRMGEREPSHMPVGAHA